jgi:hypothetical protein
VDHTEDSVNVGAYRDERFSASGVDGKDNAADAGDGAVSHTEGRRDVVCDRDRHALVEVENGRDFAGDELG